MFRSIEKLRNEFQPNRSMNDRSIRLNDEGHDNKFHLKVDVETFMLLISR